LMDELQLGAVQGTPDREGCPLSRAGWGRPRKFCRPGSTMGQSLRNGIIELSMNRFKQVNKRQVMFAIDDEICGI